MHNVRLRKIKELRIYGHAELRISRISLTVNSPHRVHGTQEEYKPILAKRGTRVFVHMRAHT